MAPAHVCRRYVLSDDAIADTFDRFDLDKDGYLDKVEVAVFLRTVKGNPTRAQLDFIFAEMDREKSGKINKDEFIHYLRCPPIYRMTMAELEQLFRQSDADGDGAITHDEVRDILANMADIHDEEAIDAMFNATDSNQDGRISFNEFVHMIRDE